MSARLCSEFSAPAKPLPIHTGDRAAGCVRKYAGGGKELWKSDGTSGGTVLVKDVFPGPTGAVPYNLANVGGTLYFSANDGVSGIELWMSDGTAAGTVRASDLRLGPIGSSPSRAFDFNGIPIFTANDGFYGAELWKLTLDRPTIGTVTLGSALAIQPPYGVPTGSGEQLRTAALASIDRITLSFGADMIVAQGHLSLFNGAGQQAISGFSYDAATRSATWSLATPLLAGEYTLVLDDAVTDVVGNLLDGEWDNPTDLADPSSSTVSGNGVPGGDFLFRFTVLPGDSNRDNRVTGGDFTIWADRFDRGLGPADKVFTDADFNGDGHVTGADYTLWADHFGLDFREPSGAATPLGAWPTPRQQPLLARAVDQLVAQPEPAPPATWSKAAPRVDDLRTPCGSDSAML